MTIHYGKCRVLMGMLEKVIFALLCLANYSDAHITYIEAKFPLKVSIDFANT